MPLTRLHVWDRDATPTGAELNAEFNNIYAKFSSGITAGDISDEVLQTDATAINAASYDTIQEAINDAVINSKNVMFPPGTYNADSQPIEVPANIRLIGAGASLVTITPAAGYVHSKFIRLVGAYSAIENVTIDVTNLSTAGLFSLIAIESPNASDIQIRNCIIKGTSAPAGTQANLLEVSAGTAAGELVEVKGCYFDGGSVATNVILNGIKINTSYRMDIKNCRFTDFSGNSLQCDNARQLVVRHCQWYRTDVNRPNTVEVRGDFIFEHNRMESDHDFTTEGPSPYLKAYSNAEARAVIRNNIVRFLSTVTHNAGTGIFCQGNCVVTDNRGATGTGGFTYGFIHYDVLNNQDHTFMYRNTVDEGDVYYAPRGGFRNQLYGKEYDSPGLFSLGDVRVWLHYNTTESANYLHFYQGGYPSTSATYHARLALDGATDLTD